MSPEQQMSLWVFMVLDAYARQHRFSARQAADFAVENHIPGFLLGNYELLHYYGDDYVVQDIDRWLAEDAA
ncbi:MAG: DUF3791 domain-containing protein [Coriobacteriales bacterium]|jgi:hypothetical protein|nr:DUF3791 domain-containing protein [Coriobacteriales bacterium]